MFLIDCVIVVVVVFDGGGSGGGESGSLFVTIASFTDFFTFRLNSLPNRSEIKSVFDVGSFLGAGLLSFLSAPFDIDDGFHLEPSILNDARTSLFLRNVGDVDDNNDDGVDDDDDDEGPDKRRYDVDSGVSLVITFAVRGNVYVV